MAEGGGHAVGGRAAEPAAKDLLPARWERDLDHARRTTLELAAELALAATWLDSASRLAARPGVGASSPRLDFWTDSVVAVSTVRGIRRRIPQTIIEVDDAFVTIRRVGADARLLAGRGEKRIPIHAISSVQWHPPGKRMGGFIEFSLSGGDERQSRYGSRTIKAAENENAVVFSPPDQPAFEAVRQAVVEAIAATQSSRPLVPPPIQQPNAIEQLTRLADLRDRGALTEEEFATQKARLLRE